MLSDQAKESTIITAWSLYLNIVIILLCVNVLQVAAVVSCVLPTASALGASTHQEARWAALSALPTT